MFDDPLIKHLDRLPADQLLSEKHVAFLLDVSLSKLQKDRVQGNPPPYVKLGRGAVRYKLGDYRNFVKERTVSSTAQADRLNFSGVGGGEPYARIGSTIYGFVESLDMDVDEIIEGSPSVFRSMGYKIAADGA